MDIVEIILTILIIAALVLLGFVVVYLIDQSLANETFAGYANVLSKDLGTRVTYILVGKVLVPQYHDYWEINYNIDNYNVTSDVGESCYSRLEIGQQIKVNIRKGLFSTGYYPVCN